MTRAAVEVRPIDGAPFGAEVELRASVRDLATADGASLRQALALHQLLVFRTDLDDEGHQLLVSMFGRLLPQGPRVVVNDKPKGPFPIVTYVSNAMAGGSLGTFELAFHSDLAHVATPLSGLSLYAIEVDLGQTATRFASGRRAYEKLTDGEREKVERLQALFTANYAVTSDAESGRDALRRADPAWPRVVHPVVVPHPVTNERCVFVNEMMVATILGLDSEDADCVLDRLFALLYEPSNVYEHEWVNGDLVVWDNLSVQHARRRVDERAPRTLRRVVFGERAPWEQWPWSVGDAPGSGVGEPQRRDT